MSDLLAPIVAAMECDELDSFWCFAALMDAMEGNFHRDQSGMHSQLLAVRRLVECLDPELHAHLAKVDALNYFFCFRLILIAFKREFAYDDVMRLWEAFWSHHMARSACVTSVASAPILCGLDSGTRRRGPDGLCGWGFLCFLNAGGQVPPALRRRAAAGAQADHHRQRAGAAQRLPRYRLLCRPRRRLVSVSQRRRGLRSRRPRGKLTFRLRRCSAGIRHDPAVCEPALWPNRPGSDDAVRCSRDRHRQNVADSARQCVRVPPRGLLRALPEYGIRSPGVRRRRAEELHPQAVFYGCL